MNCGMSCLLIFFFTIQKLAQSQKTAKKCGLPSDILVLPDFAQDEIRAVWKDYKPGNKCEKELLITEDILTVLEMFDKEFKEKMTAGSRVADLQTTLQSKYSLNEISLPSQVQVAAADDNANYNDLGLSAPTKTTGSSSPGYNRGVQQPDAFTPNTPLPYRPPSTAAVAPKTFSAASSLSLGSGKRTSSFSGSSKTDEYTQTKPNDRPARINFTNNVHEYDAGRTTQQNNADLFPISDYEQYNAEEDSQPSTTGLRAKKTNQQGQFYEPSERLPFLRGAEPDVVAAFQQVLEDADIPSERRRQEEIHLLAVSFLNSRQLAIFNTWSTERRKRIQAREHQLHYLSRCARNALKRLALADGGSPEQRNRAIKLPANIQHELQSFARKRLIDRQQSNSYS